MICIFVINFILLSSNKPLYFADLQNVKGYLSNPCISSMTRAVPTQDVHFLLSRERNKTSAFINLFEDIVASTDDCHSFSFFVELLQRRSVMMFSSKEEGNLRFVLFLRLLGLF